MHTGKSNIDRDRVLGEGIDGKDWRMVNITTTIPVWLRDECRVKCIRFQELFLSGYNHHQKVPELLARIAQLQRIITSQGDRIAALEVETDSKRFKKVVRK